MNLLFLVTLIFEGILGLGFLLSPSMVMGTLGVTLDPVSTCLAKMFGAAIVIFAFLLWFARKSEDRFFRQAMVFSMFAYHLIILPLLVRMQLSVVVHALGWGAVGMHLILLAWSGYFLLRKQSG